VTAGRSGAGSRISQAMTSGARGAIGLLVDDGAVAVGVLLAVAGAALLAAPLAAGDTVGWVLFALVWLALAVSLRRVR